MEKVRIMALGGLDEDGKNMYCVEINEDIFVIEAGIKYPESEQLGVQCIIPDFEYLLKNKDRVKGIFITHGHDDVAGALNFLIKEHSFDVYCTALTAKILNKQCGHDICHVIPRDGKIVVAGHTVHSFPVMQSIADGIGLIFETEIGAVVYSGEFIIDYDFSNPAFSMDMNVMGKLSNKNVLCLMSESVSAKKDGYTTPKHRITSHLETFFENLEDRMIMSLYSQNIFRIIEVLELAKKYNKRVYFYKKEHGQVLQYVQDLGYYQIPKGIIVSDEEFDNDMKDVIVIVSGSGNKVFRLLNRIALGEDDKVQLKESDLVVIASPIVPGTEKEAAHMEDDIYKAGVKVVKLSGKEVLSMHASKEDLKTMLYFIKPKYYLPIKGDYSSLVSNADIAVEMGYTADKIIVLDNGQFAAFEKGNLVSTRDLIELEDMLIDGSDKTDVSGMVLRDRETLSTDGAIILGVYIDYNTKEILGGPDVQSRGVIYLKDADHIIEEIANILIEEIEEAVREDRFDNVEVRKNAKEKITRYVLKETGKKPMILPAIVEINMESQDD